MLLSARHELLCQPFHGKVLSRSGSLMEHMNYAHISLPKSHRVPWSPNTVWPYVEDTHAYSLLTN
jgi:hypothetical protein